MKVFIFPVLLFTTVTVTQRTVFAEQPTIGALAELTGNYAALGEDCRRGYVVAERHATTSARVIVSDNQNDPKAALAEFHRLVDGEGSSVIVTTRSAVGLALNPLSVHTQIPLIGVVGHPKFSENPYAVRVFPKAEDEARGIKAVLESRDENSLAVVSVEDEYFIRLAAELENILPAGSVGAKESVAPTEQDFSSYVMRILTRAPAAIFVNVGPNQIAPFVARLRESGSNARLYANFLAGSNDVRKSLGKNGDGIVFVEIDYEKQNFISAQKNETGSADTSPIGYACYVALSYAFELQKVAAKLNVSLIEAEKKVRSLETLDGPIQFVNREAQFAVVPKVIREGRVTRFTTAAP